MIKIPAKAATLLLQHQGPKSLDDLTCVAEVVASMEEKFRAFVGGAEQLMEPIRAFVGGAEQLMEPILPFERIRRPLDVSAT